MLHERPTFFKDFENAFKKYAGEIRLWFKDWEYDKDFDNTSGQAPLTRATSEMINTSQDDFSNFIEDAIEANDMPGITSEIIHSGYLLAKIPREIKPSDSRLASRLSALGYSKGSSKRVQLRVNGVRGSVWMRDPKKWMLGKDSFDYDAMRIHLEEQISAVAAVEVAETWE